MKPELAPPKEPDKGGASSKAEARTSKDRDGIFATDTSPSGQYDGSADGFHGKSLPEKTLNKVGDKTFLTSVPESEGTKKVLTKEDEDLGIYEDTDVGDDDVSDTEVELDRLREEKRQREKMEKDKARAEEKFKHDAQNLLKNKDEIRPQNVRSLTESAIQLMEKEITPRTDISLDSRLSIKTWSDPRFLQGFSLKELYWKTNQGEDVITTNIQAEMEQSR